MRALAAIGVAWCALGLAATPARAQDPSGVAVDRPMRFVLTAGMQVIGTRVGEDAETFTVQTANGLVRVRKIDIAYMDYQTNVTAPAPPVVAPGPPVVAPGPPVVGPGPAVAPAPVLTPAPPVQVMPPPPAPRRKTLLRAGITGLAVSYLLTAGIGAIASIWDNQANWMLMPVAGPMIYDQVAAPDDGVFGLLLLSTIVQSASLVALIVGAVVYGRSGAPEGSASMPPRFALTPIVAPRTQGLAWSLRL